MNFFHYKRLPYANVGSLSSLFEYPITLRSRYPLCRLQSSILRRLGDNFFLSFVFYDYLCQILKG